MDRESEADRVVDWVERKSKLPLFGFYAKDVARETGLPLDAVDAHLREMVAANEVSIRTWEVCCVRCDQLHEFSTPHLAEGEVCLRCGEDLDPTQAVPLYGFRREGR